LQFVDQSLNDYTITTETIVCLTAVHYKRLQVTPTHKYDSIDVQCLIINYWLNKRGWQSYL